ncbi:hypothetical protein ACLBOM_14235 [Escherichia coli]
MKMVEMGKYDNHLLEDYGRNSRQWTRLSITTVISCSYAAVKRLEGEYWYRTA